MTKYARPILYLSPALASLFVLFASVFSYSWSSNLINLACSIQDDSFYYLIPGWNAAHGSGFTFGGEKTSGFEPLYELLLTLLGLFCNSLGSLLRIAINFNGWLFALTALITGLSLGSLIKSAMPSIRRTAMVLSLNVAVLSFVCLHTVFFSSVTGKENALAALLLAAIICNVFVTSQGAFRSLIVGLLCGLLLLTRIAPSSIVYAAIAIILMQGWKHKFFALSSCLVPVIIWGVFAQAYFGHLLPMSMLVKMSPPNHLSEYQLIKGGVKYLWESAKFSLSAGSRFTVPPLNVREGFRSTFQIVVMAITLGLSMLGLLRCIFARPPSRAVIALLLFNAGGVLSNILFGAALADRQPEEMYYFVWYVYDLPVLVAVNCGFAVAWVQSEFSGLRFSWLGTAVLALACVAYFVDDVAWYQRLRPYDDVADTAKLAGTWQGKMIASAAWFRENVSPTNPNYRVASFSAGALSFMLFDHVIDLDGLANDSAGKAILSNSFADYMKRTKPEYFIDICKGLENQFDNLERLHVVPFPQQGGYCIARFVY
ncbi:MAG: hypothetical protein ABSG12_04200 [Steroidobacteraceae bacterium]